jgi:hypothetical protein
VRALRETVVASARGVGGLRKNACAGMQKFVPHRPISKLVVIVGQRTEHDSHCVSVRAAIPLSDYILGQSQPLRGRDRGF